MLATSVIFRKKILGENSGHPDSEKNEVNAGCKSYQLETNTGKNTRRNMLRIACQDLKKHF
jgi:hypothetical protein